MDDIIKDLKKLDTKYGKGKAKMEGGFLGALAGLLAPVIGQALGLGKSGGCGECYDDDASSVSSMSDMEEEMTLKRVPKRKHKKEEKEVEEGKGKSGAGRSGAGKSGAGKSGAGKSGAGKSGAGKSGAGKSGAGKKRVASPWAMLVKKVMVKEKKSMKDAIKHIQDNGLYKK
jgi:hypothetical protein